MDEKPQKITFDISWSAILKVVAVILAIFLLYLVRSIFAIFIVSLVLAALIDPLADWFAKRRIPRALAVLLIYIVLLGSMSLVVTLLVPPLIEQSDQLVKKMAAYIGDLLGRVSSLRDLAISKGFAANGEDALSSLQAGLPKALSGVYSTLTGFFGGLVTLILILVLTFYMVVESDALKKFFKSIAPEKYQPHLVGLFTRAQHKIGSWMRGVLVLSVIVGVFIYAGLTILGVKYALVIGILAGLTEMIPYFGPVISSIPAVFLALSQSPVKGAMVVALFILCHQLENHVLVPKIMQKAVGINPVLSILAMGVGFQLAGFFGILLAIPTATALSVFVADFIELKKRS